MTLATKIALGTALLVAAAAGGFAPSAAQEAPETPPPAAKAADPHADLVRKLGDADFAERTKAYDALRAAGGDVREALRAGARSEDPEVRWSASRLLRLLDGQKGGERHPSILRFREDAAPGDRGTTLRPLPVDEESFRGTLDSLRERLTELERNLEGHEMEMRPLLQGGIGALQGMELHAVSEKDGERVEVHHGRDGRVKVTIAKKGEVGAEKSETFESESMEALEKEHPEAHAKAKAILGDRVQVFRGGLRFGSQGLGELRQFDRHLLPDGTFEFLPAEKPVLGVGVSPVPPVLRTQLSLPEEEGIVVEEVHPDSLAARLDLRRHDVILRVNGIPVSTAGEVRAAVEAVKEGGPVRLDVLRAGKRIDLTGTR